MERKHNFFERVGKYIPLILFSFIIALIFKKKYYLDENIFWDIFIFIIGLVAFFTVYNTSIELCAGCTYLKNMFQWFMGGLLFYNLRSLFMLATEIKLLPESISLVITNFLLFTATVAIFFGAMNIFYVYREVGGIKN